ncbi:lipopolysaccharide biosynthesis protein [Tropicimonas marinistellae]|uniref:lipopolysaccharide biosynthesis protein n=1 Tax=Tropicimonas marinistellae TaxID=1739787 RepID=UPI00082C9458|nr:lipopolysaccharide biosynthesis protein [Tropicimonas marinistellae]
MSRISKGLPYLATIGHRGFTAGTNLVLTIVAGRALEVADFGALALMMAVIGLLMIFHSTLFSEPMLVYGPRDYQASLQRYLGFLGSTQFGAGLLISVAIGVGGLILGKEGYLAFAIVVPLALSLDFQDRSFFMQLNPVVPFASSVIQFATLTVLLFLGSGTQTIGGFLGIYATSFLAANLFQLVAHLRTWPQFGTAELARDEVVRRHVRFAAWSMASHLLLFLVTNFYIFVLPVLQDIETTAVFRAQSAIIGPGAQAFSALGLIAVPMLRVSTDRDAFVGKLMRFLAVITALGVPIILVLGMFGRPLIGLIYADKYALSPLGYWLVGLYPLAIGYAFMIGSALRALDRADLIARAAGVAVVLTLPLGLYLTSRFGVEGVIIAQVLGCLTVTGHGVYTTRLLLHSHFEKAT